MDVKPMEVGRSTFAELFGKSNTICYCVPFFQRGYVWKKKDWKNLYDEIVDEIFGKQIEKIERDEVKEKKLFFGTIVLKKQRTKSLSNDMARFDIIDGQQRFITCYTLCIVLYKKLKELERKYQDPATSSQEYKKYLYNSDDKTNNYNQLKIVSTQGGTLSLYELLYEGTPTLPDGQLERERKLQQKNIEEMSKYWKRNIQNYEKEAILKWLDVVLHSLQTACIYLPDNFDEQVIFETLNASGQELTTGELLCNYIFRKIKPPSQDDSNELHYEKWLKPQRELEQTQIKVSNKVSNNEEYSSFESYLRYLFSIDQDGMVPKNKNFYVWFKNEYTEPDAVSKKLDAVSEHLPHFQAYLDPDSNDCDEKIKNKLSDISSISNHSVIPFILDLLHSHENKKEHYAAVDMIEHILSIIIVMLLRNKVIGSNPKYDTFFPQLLKNMKNESNDPPNALIKKIKDHGWYIPDDQFRGALIEREIYNSNHTKLAHYILRNLDRKMSSYDQQVEYGNFTQIEHVLPQQAREKLNDTWQEELGKDLEDERFETLKDSVGNLTIIGRGNPAIGASSIKDKINHKAYGHPRPPLTQSIIDIYGREGKWNLSTIQKRSAELAKIACKVWSWPQ